MRPSQELQVQRESGLALLLVLSSHQKARTPGAGPLSLTRSPLYVTLRKFFTNIKTNFPRVADLYSHP